MSLNLDDVVRAGDVEIQHRIKRYDVQWGRPHFAVTYKRLMLSKMPAYYWSMENSVSGAYYYSRNWGTAGTNYNLQYALAAEIFWYQGQADPTDNAVDFSGVSYAEAVLPSANSALLPGYSIVFWMKPNSVVADGSFYGLVSKQNSYGQGGSSTDAVCSIHLESYQGANRLAFHFNANDVFYTDISSVVLEPDTWYCVALVVEPGGPPTDPDKPISEDNPRTWVDQNPMRIYVNGVEVYSDNTLRNNLGQAATGTTKWLVGASREGGNACKYFNGLMDEVGVFGRAFSSYTIAQIFAVGLGATYLEPDEDFDNDVVGAYTDQRRYPEMVLADGPVHYWKMDTVEDGAGDEYKYVDDAAGVALYERNLSVARNAGQWSTSRIVTSPILATNYTSADPPGKALEFSGDTSRQGEVKDRVDLLNDEIRAQTVEFWYRRKNTSSHWDGLIGFHEAWGSGEGFVVAINREKIRAYYSFKLPSVQHKYVTTEDVVEIEKEEWYHIVTTLDRNGEARLYVNGQLVDVESWGSNYYYRGPRKANLTMGGVSEGMGDPHQRSPAFEMDDVAIYTKALTPSEIYAHYWTGKVGPYARVSLTGGDPLQEPSPFVIGTNEYSELANEEDITEYVESYSFDDDVKQLVPTASLTVYEDWGANEIVDKLNANTYVKIERRFLSQSRDYDSGWVDFGHFLCEGPLGSSYSAQGTRVFNVALKGLTKLFTLDLAHTPIEPDKLLVQKRKLDVTQATTEYTKYYMSRYPDVPTIDNVYYNWAEFPSVKLWVTDFKNLGDEEEGGVDDPKEVIRIKGSEGAVRVLGGEGAVVIDNTYLLDRISENGLSDPSTLLAEFYRYATIEDKVITTIASMEVIRNKWRIGLASQKELIDGKTLMVKSGTAKGKLWKLEALGGNRLAEEDYTIDADTTIGNVGPGNHQWTKESDFGYAPPPPTTSYAARATGDDYSTWDFDYLSIPLTLSVPASSIDWDDDSKIVGIKMIVQRRARGDRTPWPLRDGVKDIGVRLRIGAERTDEALKAERWSAGVGPGAWESVTYGDERQPLGVTWTWGDIKDSLDDVAYEHSVQIDGAGGGRANLAEIYAVRVELHIEDIGVVTLFDIHGYPVHPEYEGLAVGDQVQIGDFNSVEDAIRKAAYRCGFQENDSTKPFYFEFDACPTSLAPSVPPVRPKVSEETYWAEMVESILEYAPPNYRLATDSGGVLRAKLLGFLVGESRPDHILIGRLDINVDRGDYGIATRLIVEGEGPDSFNIGLNVNAGGTSAVKAYVLEGYADPDKQPDRQNSLGITLTQAEADAKWQQVFNGNPKSPVPSTSNDWKDRYGVILAKESEPAKVKRWDFEDLPLCAIDIGKSATDTAIEIEALEFTWINHYLEGNAITQSMIVHYMTEEAYEAEFGVALPNEPNQDDMAYFPDAGARSWKLLLDEFAFSDGTTTMESSDFEDGEPVKVRFLKFTCGQGHYRFPVKINDGDKDAAIRVTLSECRIWTSKRIIATAEIGVSGIFASGDYKELATRLRRRSDYLEKNLYLNNYEKAKNFALAELQDRYVDFTPVAVTAFAPTIEVGDVVHLVHPEKLGIERITRAACYLVAAVSHDKTGIVKAQVVNYDIETVPEICV